MPNPTKYDPHFSYTGFESHSPKRPKPGPELDDDFANISRSVNETIDALSDIRREDGKLQNGIVTSEALAPGALDEGYEDLIGEMTALAGQTRDNAAAADASADRAAEYVEVFEKGLTVRVQRVLTVAGQREYTVDADGNTIDLPMDAFVVFRAPFGLADTGARPAGGRSDESGKLILDFAPEEAELLHVISYPRVSNSEAQAIVSELWTAHAEVVAIAGSLQPFASRSDVAGVVIPAAQVSLMIDNNGEILRYVRGPNGGTGITTNGGTVHWIPEGPVTPDHFGAYVNETTDMTAAINAAAAFLGSNGGGKLKLIRNVKVNGYVRLRSNTTLDLDGHTLDASDNDSTSTIRPRAIGASGVYGPSVPMTANSAKMSSTVTATGHGLAAGDMVIVGSDMLFDPDNTLTRLSEMAFVKSVLGNVVTLLSPLAFAYAAVNGGYIQKITPVENINILGGHIIGPKLNTEDKAFHSIKIVGGRNISVTGVSFEGASHADVSLVDVTAGRVVGNNFEGSDETAQLAYAVSFANNSCDSVAIGNTFNMRRHCISTNNEGAADWGTLRGIVSRIKFEGNVIRRSANYIDGDFLGDPLDTHGGAAAIEIINNTVYHANGAGINVECMSATVRGNVIHISEGIGIRCHNETAFSGPLVVDDNEIHQPLNGRQAIVIEEGFRAATTAGFTTISCNGNKVYGGSAGIGINVERHKPRLTVNGNMIEGVTGDGIGVVSQGQTAICGNNVTAGGECIQVNDPDGVTISGNACRTTSISARGIMILGGRNASIVGNAVTMPDGSTSDAIFVGSLTGVPHMGASILGNTLLALGVNAGIGVNVLGNTITGKVAGNVYTGFATNESLGTAIVREASRGGDDVVGHWVRHADGTQECWISRSVNTTTVAIGTVFRDVAAFGVWTFPVPFLASPVVEAGAYGSQNWCSIIGRTATEISGVAIFAPAASTGDRTIVVRAVGRWR